MIQLKRQRKHIQQDNEPQHQQNQLFDPDFPAVPSGGLHPEAPPVPFPEVASLEGLLQLSPQLIHLILGLLKLNGGSPVGLIVLNQIPLRIDAVGADWRIKGTAGGTESILIVIIAFFTFVTRYLTHSCTPFYGFIIPQHRLLEKILSKQHKKPFVTDLGSMTKSFLIV